MNGTDPRLFRPENAPPGSPAAKTRGCLCPVMDNCGGRGWMGGVTDERGEIVYVRVGGCPLHNVDEGIASEPRVDSPAVPKGSHGQSDAPSSTKGRAA